MIYPTWSGTGLHSWSPRSHQLHVAGPAGLAGAARAPVALLARITSASWTPSAACRAACRALPAWATASLCDRGVHATRAGDCAQFGCKNNMARHRRRLSMLRLDWLVGTGRAVLGAVADLQPG